MSTEGGCLLIELSFLQEEVRCEAQVVGWWHEKSQWGQTDLALITRFVICQLCGPVSVNFIIYLLICK